MFILGVAIGRVILEPKLLGCGQRYDFSTIILLDMKNPYLSVLPESSWSGLGNT